MLRSIISFDGDFHGSQDGFADLADGAAQGGYGLGCVEIQYRGEILRGKVVTLCQTASGKQGIVYADCRRIDESHAFVIFMIAFQSGTVNDAEDILLVGQEVLRCVVVGNLFQLLRKVPGAGDGELLFQVSGDRLFMLRTVAPEVGTAGSFAAAGVGDIEHILELRSVPRGINQGNALGSPADVAAHVLVPDVKAGTGSGFRALGIDQELLVVRILVQPGGGVQKIGPAEIAAGDSDSGFLCQPGITCDIAFPEER